jgi:uncharacterized membrane protein YgdD (TMEM256/DUF423 family)
MVNKVGFLACIFGWTAIAIGAFGAHGLSHQLSVRELNLIQTAFEYQLIHAVVLLWLSRDRAMALSSFIVICFSGGVFLFSGSLYLIAIMQIPNLGMITPFGGIGLLTGWFLLGLRCLRTKITATDEPINF